MATYNVKSLSFTKNGNTYNIDAGSSYYAVCTTAGATQTKAVTISEITSLEEGLSVRIIFSNEQLYDGVPKLQINSLTAANIQSVSGVDGTQYMWKAGEVIDLIYNGTNWIVVGRGATPSTRIIQVSTTVTNTSGAYTTTIQDARISSDMKALSLEIANPYVFNDKITVTCANGSVTFACNDVCGTSAVTINIVKAALDATTISSEEFDILDASKVDKTDFYATEMAMSTSDNTTVSEAIEDIENTISSMNTGVFVVTLDSVTNTSGSYTHTTTVSGMTSDLKCVKLECSDPTIFRDTVDITSGTNSVTLTCSNVVGSSTVKASFLAVGNGNPLSSSEYAALDTRIGQLADLDTTDKTDIVSAINSDHDKMLVGTISDLERTENSSSSSSLLVEYVTPVDGWYHICVGSGNNSSSEGVIKINNKTILYCYGADRRNDSMIMIKAGITVQLIKSNNGYAFIEKVEY